MNERKYRSNCRRWNRKRVQPVKVIFTSRDNAVKANDIYKPNHIVACLGPNRKSRLNPTLHLVFDDIELTDISKIPILVTGGRSAVAPSFDHVKQLVDLGRSLKDDDVVLVHCEAGVSRSAAAALIILIAHYGINQIDRCICEMRESNLHANPNQLMIKYADQIFGTKGQILQAVERHVGSSYMHLHVTKEQQEQTLAYVFGNLYKGDSNG